MCAPNRRGVWRGGRRVERTACDPTDRAVGARSARRSPHVPESERLARCPRSRKGSASETRCRRYRHIEWPAIAEVQQGRPGPLASRCAGPHSAARSRLTTAATAASVNVCVRTWSRLSVSPPTAASIAPVASAKACALRASSCSTSSRAAHRRSISRELKGGSCGPDPRVQQVLRDAGALFAALEAGDLDTDAKLDQLRELPSGLDRPMP